MESSEWILRVFCFELYSSKQLTLVVHIAIIHLNLAGHKAVFNVDALITASVNRWKFDMYNGLYAWRYLQTGKLTPETVRLTRSACGLVLGFNVFVYDHQIGFVGYWCSYDWINGYYTWPALELVNASGLPGFIKSKSRSSQAPLLLLF